jgi:2-polyprenyl-3-methyl-5-hydroxy-6-metoxy-1,4-benzoquinol methylase
MLHLMAVNMTYKFINKNDALGLAINTACEQLFTKLQNLDISNMNFEPFFKSYFEKCHLQRPYFSLETAARLLYNSIKAQPKPHTEVIIMDYGAGLGSVYLLAKLIGVKKIIYNDLLPEFAKPAMQVDQALGLIMDEYIIGDTLDTMHKLKDKNIQVDIIISRNVVEHIYDLGYFFSTIFEHQPQAIMYHSTTANWVNPAAHLQHVWMHKKYRPQVITNKQNIIAKLYPSLTTKQTQMLANALVQYGGAEFTQALQNFVQNNAMPKPKNDYTNICDENGTWCEHLLPYSKYRKMASNYSLTFLPGFWDEHYKNKAKKILGKVMNILTLFLGKAGVVNSSFFYIECKPNILK